MKTFLLFLFTISLTYASNIKVGDVSIEEKGTYGKLTIQLSEKLSGWPEVKVKGKYLQISIPEAMVWPKIEKNFTAIKPFDAKLMAYQFDKNLVRVRAVFPESIESIKESVDLQLKGKKIIVNYLNNFKRSRKVSRSPAIEKTTKKKSVDSFDESYLDKLLKQKEEKRNIGLKEQAKPLLGEKEILNTNGSYLNDSKRGEDKKDEVKLSLSSSTKNLVKEKGSNFSLLSYVGKFVGFLSLVLLIFYGFVTVLKRGAFKKSKLGFLNSTKIIEVLNTTYIGQKRSMLLIRAHNQVFLVGSSEKGLHMISELRDVNGLLKEGEKQVGGSNFDTTLSDEESRGKDFKLKELLEGTSHEKEDASENIALNAIESEMKKAKESDSSRFSDQIKNKIKNLKPLRQ